MSRHAAHNLSLYGEILEETVDISAAQVLQRCVHRKIAPFNPQAAYTEAILRSDNCLAMVINKPRTTKFRHALESVRMHVAGLECLLGGRQLQKKVDLCTHGTECLNEMESVSQFLNLIGSQYFWRDFKVIALYPFLVRSVFVRQFGKSSYSDESTTYDEEGRAICTTAVDTVLSGIVTLDLPLRNLSALMRDAIEFERKMDNVFPATAVNDPIVMEGVRAAMKKEIRNESIVPIGNETDTFFERVESDEESWASVARRLQGTINSNFLVELHRQYLITMSLVKVINKEDDHETAAAYLAYQYPGQPVQLRCTILQRFISAFHTDLGPISDGILARMRNKWSDNASSFDGELKTRLLRFFNLLVIAIATNFGSSDAFLTTNVAFLAMCEFKQSTSKFEGCLDCFPSNKTSP